MNQHSTYNNRKEPSKLSTAIHAEYIEKAKYDKNKP